MKYCSKCGNELSEETAVCPKCGCPVKNTAPEIQTEAEKAAPVQAQAENASNKTSEVSQSSSPTPTSAPTPAYTPTVNANMHAVPTKPQNNLPNKKKKAGMIFTIIEIIINALGSVFGIVATIFGIAFDPSEYGLDVADSSTYGADFYTDVQNATVDAANNVRSLANIVENSVKAVIVIFGIFAIIFFLQKLIGSIKEIVEEKKL